MTENDALLIDQVLAKGVEEFEKIQRQQDYLNLPLRNIHGGDEFGCSYSYLSNLFEAVEALHPCPVKVTRGNITVLQFTVDSVDFLNKGGYMKLWKNEQERIQIEEQRAAAAHRVNVDQIEGGWRVTWGFWVGLAALIVSIIALFKG